MTTNDSEWYNKWQRVVQRVTTNDKEWQRVIRNDYERYNEWQRMQQVTIPANFSFFFQIKEEPTTKHPKQNFLNLEEDLWRRPIELRAETSTQKEILTVRSRNCRSSCSQIFTKIMFLKILQYSPFNRFAGFKTCNFLKKDSNTGVFLCWSPCLRKLHVLKPANLLKGDSNTGAFLWILRNF